MQSMRSSSAVEWLDALERGEREPQSLPRGLFVWIESQGFHRRRPRPRQHELGRGRDRHVPQRGSPRQSRAVVRERGLARDRPLERDLQPQDAWQNRRRSPPLRDRKSTRLNSSHANISYAVFCLKKKKNTSL